MENTRLMTRLFSATEEGDAELTKQVGDDIENAKANGQVDTDELSYVNLGEGKVCITDKENGEQTIAEQAEDGNYDLYPAEMSQQIEGYIHPEGDGVTPGQQQGAPDENYESHMDGNDVISPNLPDGGLNPQAGSEKSVTETAAEGPEAEECEDPRECEEEKKFSVSTDNTVVQRIFCDQEFCERLFSEVIESEDTAKVGDLKVEKVADEPAVVVTDENTGDQAKVTLDDENMEVTELGTKSFSEEEESEEFDQNYDALHVVGVDTFNHQIIDAEEYDEESAQDLVARLQEIGVDAVQVFDNPEEARDYAMNLLASLGVQSEEDIDEPQQAEFSEHDIFVTRYFSDNTVYMDRLFSEACNDIDASQSKIEDAIENGKEVSTEEGETIIPVDEDTAIVEDNGEYTKVTINDDTMECEPIDKEEAKAFCAVNDFDYNEDVAERMFSEEEDYSDFDYNEDVAERMFSENEEEQIYSNEEQTKFFSENEEMTDYMVRLFSEEADESEIEDAIEHGEQIENDSEVITPVDATTAIVEDKNNGEFTKAVMDDDKLDVTPISEEEADELTKNLQVENTDKDDDEKEEEKEYSDNNYVLSKFFADIQNPQVAPQGQIAPAANIDPATGQEIIPAVADPNTGQLVPVDQGQGAEQGAPTVEAVEDKAMAAVESIKAAAAEAEATILNAKAAPVEGQEAELQEAQFSYYDDDDYDNNEECEDRTFSENDTLISWLNNR